MELGGVGSPARRPFVGGAEPAATAAKVSRPLQVPVPDGFGMSTESDLPAKAMAMEDLLMLLEEAIFR